MRRVALALLFVATTLGAAERRVVFAVRSGADGAFVEPIVRLDPIDSGPKGFEGDAADAETRAFAKRYFASDRRYGVYAGGVRVGSLQPGTKYDAGCVSLAATASIDGRKPAEDETMLATNFALPTRESSNERDVSVGEAAALRRYGAVFLRARGVEVPQSETLLTNARVYDVGHDESIVAGTIWIDDRECSVKSLGAVFVIARLRDVSPSNVTPQVAKYLPRATCDESANSEPIGALDVDGDGIDELFVRDWLYEGEDYYVWRRTATGKWVAVRGASSGC